MKVALYEGPHTLRVTSKPTPRPKEEEVLVRVEACGVCGTDVHIVEGASRSTPPVVLGHEYVGVIEELGRQVSSLERGQRVAVDPNISCGRCYYCRRGLVHLCTNLKALGVDIDGGMAEYCIVPEGQAYPLPEEMSPKMGVFVEPVSCAIHGIDKANIRAGDTIVILGGGTIGLIMLQLAKHAGAARTVVLEPLEQKRILALDLGASLALDPEAQDVKSAVLDFTRVGADSVIECVGKPETMELSLQLARRGGTVEFFGVCPIGSRIAVEPNEVYFKELTIVGSYVNPHTFSRSIEVLRSRAVRVDLFPVADFALDDVQEALMRQREGKTFKSIIRPTA